MKRFILLMAALCCMYGLVNAQGYLPPDSIYYEFDVMTDKEYLLFNRQLVCSEDKKKGFIITARIELDGTEANYKGLRVEMFEMGACCENNQIIFLFDDDTKHTMTSWNKYNCDAYGLFDFYARDWAKISTKKIKAIRVTNGATYDSYTYQLKEGESSYFMTCAELMAKYRKE